MNFVTKPQDMVGYYVGKWRELNQISNGAQLENLSLKEMQSKAYSQIGYVDSFMNCMPTFIGRALSSDFERLQEYNQIRNQLAISASKISALENEKAATIRQIFSAVVSNPNGVSQVHQLQKQLDQLVLLEQRINAVITSLNQAENSEWWDGQTSDHHFMGAMNDFESRRDNFKAGQLIADLNNQIKLYNQQLLYLQPADFQMGFEARPLQELYGLGENIINAELNESNPLYKLGGGLGDWWASGNTLQAIRSAQASVRALGSEVSFQRSNLQQALNHFVMKKLMQDYPGFVEEANLLPAQSLSPSMPYHYY